MQIIEKTSLDKQGFKGIYYKAKNASNKTIIVIIGDEANDIMNKACAKYLINYVNVLSIGIKQNKHDNGLVSFKLEFIEKAINYLKDHNQKIGILGVSMQSSIALVSASMFNDISLVIGISPNDFVSWGFVQGTLDKYKHAEWPSYTSSLSYKGRDLAYHHINLSKHEYYKMYLDAKDQYHEMHSKVVFDYAEQVNPIEEEAFIKLEKAKAKVILVASSDDSMWDSVKYVKRLKTRLETYNYAYPFKSYIYEYGTHLLFPQRMMKAMLPIFYNSITKLYVSGRKHAHECTKTRLNFDDELSREIQSW